MVIAIEGIWKHGKVVPLEDIEVEENTIVTINISVPTVKKKSLAGAWKNYKTIDNKTLDEVKKEIFDSRKPSTRKEVIL